VRADLGPIRVLVNNAANDERHKVDEVTVEYWDRAQDINLKHQFFAAQAVRPQMRELGGGSIVNFSSIAWRGGASNMVAYGVAKAAILGLTRALGREFGPDKIRVNAIEPGAVIRKVSTTSSRGNRCSASCSAATSHAQCCSSRRTTAT
jgi:NAD(P)-dependent dehydrogenase (short-subunit alcohol dehydrogenase family)